MIYIVFDERPIDEELELGVEEVSFVDFLELTIFYQILLIWFLWSLYGEWEFYF